MCIRDRDDAQETAWDMTGRILDDICDIFPFPVIHIGGAVADEDIWLASPRAAALQGGRQLAATRDLRRDYLRRAHDLLRTHYLRRVHALLQSRGRVTGAQAPLAQGRAIPPDDSLLFVGDQDAGPADLLSRGYRLVGHPHPGAAITPGLAGAEVTLACPAAAVDRTGPAALSLLAQAAWAGDRAASQARLRPILGLMPWP